MPIQRPSRDFLTNFIRQKNKLGLNLDNSYDDTTERKYEKSLGVASVLGGLTLTVLAVLIQPGDNPVFCMNNNQISSTIDTPFCKYVLNVGKDHPDMSHWLNYKQILIGGLGLVSTFFIVSIFGMKAALVNYQKDTFSEYSHRFYEAGIVGLVISLPFLVMPFSIIFGIIIIIFLAIWGPWYIKWRQKSRDKR
jgi:hypothetical protein